MMNNAPNNNQRDTKKQSKEEAEPTVPVSRNLNTDNNWISTVEASNLSSSSTSAFPSSSTLSSSSASAMPSLYAPATAYGGDDILSLIIAELDESNLGSISSMAALSIVSAPSSSSLPAPNDASRSFRWVDRLSDILLTGLVIIMAAFFSGPHPYSTALLTGVAMLIGLYVDAKHIYDKSNNLKKMRERLNKLRARLSDIRSNPANPSNTPTESNDESGHYLSNCFRDCFNNRTKTILLIFSAIAALAFIVEIATGWVDTLGINFPTLTVILTCIIAAGLFHFARAKYDGPIARELMRIEVELNNQQRTLDSILSQLASFVSTMQTIAEPNIGEQKISESKEQATKALPATLIDSMLQRISIDYKRAHAKILDLETKIETMSGKDRSQEHTPVDETQNLLATNQNLTMQSMSALAAPNANNTRLDIVEPARTAISEITRRPHDPRNNTYTQLTEILPTQNEPSTPHQPSMLNLSQAPIGKNEGKSQHVVSEDKPNHTKSDDSVKDRNNENANLFS